MGNSENIGHIVFGTIRYLMVVTNTQKYLQSDYLTITCQINMRNSENIGHIALETVL